MGILMVDDVRLYAPFLHPLAVDTRNTVFASVSHVFAASGNRMCYSKANSVLL